VVEESDVTELAEARLENPEDEAEDDVPPPPPPPAAPVPPLLLLPNLVEVDALEEFEEAEENSWW